MTEAKSGHYQRTANPFKVEFVLNGLFFSLYDTAVQQSAKIAALSERPKLTAFPPYDIRDFPAGAIREKRNLHLIILESYIFPDDMTGVTFNQDAAPGQFGTWAREARFTSYSPVFGGQTANGEFEMLCGTPVYDLFAAMTFSTLKGTPVDCLPRLLQKAGYHTISSAPVHANYYDRTNAYGSMGFREMIFEDRFEFDDTDGKWLSNSSMLRQNLDHLRAAMKDQDGKPIFNYVVTAGGHYPFELNTENRPYKIFMEPSEEKFAAVLNFAYYTALALNDYFAELQKIDPDAVVLMITDHLPPVPKQNDYWQHYGGVDPDSPISFHRAFGLLLDRYEPRRLGTIAHHEISGVLLDLLSEGRICGERDCLHKQDWLIRPPQIFDRNAVADPICGGDDQRAQCLEAGKASDALLEVYYDLMRTATLGAGS